MAEAVVDEFQIVEIQKEQRKRLPRAFDAPYLAFEALEEFPVVRKSRQSIMAGTEADFVLRLLAFGDVESDPNAPEDRAIGIPVRPDAQIVDAIATDVFQPGRDAAAREQMLAGE